MIRVILVDDHTLVREGIKAMLQSWPDISVVGQADCAVEGLRRVEQVPCDLLVSDFSLPDHSVPWLITQVRKIRPQMRVLVLSQHTEFEKVRQILSLGANGYLVKTASRDELRQALSVVGAGGIYLHPSVSRALAAPEPDLLSARHRMLLQMLVQGLSNSVIARHLEVSLGTVKGDLQALFGKFGVKDRTHLAATALARGLVESPT